MWRKCTDKKIYIGRFFFFSDNHSSRKKNPCFDFGECFLFTGIPSLHFGHFLKKNFYVLSDVGHFKSKDKFRIWFKKKNKKVKCKGGNSVLDMHSLSRVVNLTVLHFSILAEDTIPQLLLDFIITKCFKVLIQKDPRITSFCDCVNSFYLYEMATPVLWAVFDFCFLWNEAEHFSQAIYFLNNMEVKFVFCEQEFHIKNFHWCLIRHNLDNVIRSWGF